MGPFHAGAFRRHRIYNFLFLICGKDYNIFFVKNSPFTQANEPVNNGLAAALANIKLD